jgi:hypothetical protein
MPATSMASEGSAVKVRPLGRAVMVNVILAIGCVWRAEEIGCRAQKQTKIVANSEIA